ncbi:MAG: hybrid sensor histidine kinase/response regulator [Candidatus Gastranaerophilales bacterium]|nr:hybrid sensor histidine kinase/response regulator [Candidatus Gastranaerophilales bacterium]
MYKVLFIEKNISETEIDFQNNDEFVMDKITFEEVSDKINNYQLCIIKLNTLENNELQKIKNIIQNYHHIDFWATNNSCTKNDILKAYNLGFKNFIQLPLDKDIIVNSLKKNKLKNNEKYGNIKINFSDYQNSQILIVDDMCMNIELLKEVLSPFKITPDCYMKPFDALKIIDEKKYDLILLDIVMPGLNGFEFAEKLKLSNKNKATPVIFISALDNIKVKIQSYNLGSYAYINKPIDIKSTRVQIYNALKIKRLQDSLFNEKEKLDTIFQFSRSEIILTDKNFNIISQNHRYTMRSVQKACNFIELIKEDNTESNVSKINDFATQNEQNLTIKINYHNDVNGHLIPANACISKIFSTLNTLDGYLIIINDITQEVQNQKQKETFIATLTHDLKTPIRAQIQALQLILNNKFGIVDGELASILNEILSSCKFMQHMTDNLLTKYKTQNGHMILTKEKKSIYDIIKKNSEQLKYLLEQKNQTVKIINETKFDELELDPLAIKRVLNNLIINASEYTPENGTITIKIEDDNDKLKVSVIDTGWGIPEEDKDTIFDEYISTAKRFRKVGYGLGLYICKKIIEEHNGNIYVNSEEGKGTEFVFTLPLSNSIVNF